MFGDVFGQSLAMVKIPPGERGPGLHGVPMLRLRRPGPAGCGSGAPRRALHGSGGVERLGQDDAGAAAAGSTETESWDHSISGRYHGRSAKWDEDYGTGRCDGRWEGEGFPHMQMSLSWGLVWSLKVLTWFMSCHFQQEHIFHSHQTQGSALSTELWISNVQVQWRSS